MSLMAKNKRLCLKACELIEPDEFSNSVYQTLFVRLGDAAKAGELLDESKLLDEFSGNVNSENMAASVFFNNEEYRDDYETLYDLIFNIKSNGLERRIKEATEPDEIFKLIQEKNELSQSRKQW